MAIDSIGGLSSLSTFGVDQTSTGGVDTTTKTQDISAKQAFGAEVVKTTLDYMNSGSMTGTGNNADYAFQTKVLTAGAVTDTGTMLNGKV